jgi:hypothetical protein
LVPTGHSSFGRLPCLSHNVSGLRCVIPYPYTFKVFAKERWIGKPLLEVVLEEFRANDENYYVRGTPIYLFFLFGPLFLSLF